MPAAAVTGQETINISKPVKNITIKIFPPPDRAPMRPEVKQHTAPPKKLYNADGIRQLLTKYTLAIYKELAWEYRVMKISDKQYNFLPVQPAATPVDPALLDDEGFRDKVMVELKKLEDAHNAKV